MPKKSHNCGIKIWCLANSTSKFVCDFDIYCGHNIEGRKVGEIPWAKCLLARDVVLGFAQRLAEKGHLYHNG